jgi:hypothetical protein
MIVLGLGASALSIVKYNKVVQQCGHIRVAGLKGFLIY